MFKLIDFRDYGDLNSALSNLNLVEGGGGPLSEYNLGKTFNHFLPNLDYFGIVII